ncbi:thioester domain-containing protein [Microbacterium lushaniae]|uniref:Uncharacterized protein n=1 Tax=Microbacterium lushaniae TaxID=2614639 RepID=A0A5J6L2G5_9MICO|nr:thioester domain-containing protein [Microbacterium lushaniae]QEW02572.1 hypothetical protein F6J85_05285 [Microbacterium lushaniae]
MALAIAAMLIVPVGGAANAWIEDGAPVIESPDGPDTAIELASTGAGQRISGGYPATAVVPDPQADYPAAPPAGYTVRSGFAGVLNVARVSDLSQRGQVFCISARTPAYVGVGYESGSWSESEVANLGQVAYILNNYYPAVPGAPATLGTPNQRAAAVQAAIWYFTDGFVLDPADSVRAATAEIIADAQGNSPAPEPELPLAITPASSSVGVGSLAGPFTVTADAAAVALAVPAGYAMYGSAVGGTPLPNPYTTTSGAQVWVGSESGAADTTVLTATASVAVPRGRVYLYDGLAPGLPESQPLILAETAQLETTATAQATAEFFAVAGLTITKAFAGDAVGQQGAMELVVDCGDGVPRSTTIPAGASTTQSFPFTGIGVGATCVITEPTTGATTAVDVTSDAPQQVVITDTGATATITNTVTRRGDVPGVLPATGTETPFPLLWGGLAGLLGGALLVAARLTLLRQPGNSARPPWS